MQRRNREDWVTALPIVALVAFAAVLAFAAVTAGTQFASNAVAAEPARYVMTITAERPSRECKVASCAYAGREAVTVREIR